MSPSLRPARVGRPRLLVRHTERRRRRGRRTRARIQWRSRIGRPCHVRRLSSGTNGSQPRRPGVRTHIVSASTTIDATANGPITPAAANVRTASIRHTAARRERLLTCGSPSARRLRQHSRAARHAAHRGRAIPAPHISPKTLGPRHHHRPHHHRRRKRPHKRSPRAHPRRDSEDPSQPAPYAERSHRSTRRRAMSPRAFLIGHARREPRPQLIPSRQRRISDRLPQKRPQRVERFRPSTPLGQPPRQRHHIVHTHLAGQMTVQRAPKRRILRRLLSTTRSERRTGLRGHFVGWPHIRKTAIPQDHTGGTARKRPSRRATPNSALPLVPERLP